MVIKCLTTGSFSKAFTCRHGRTGTLAVVKIPRARGFDSTARLRHEAGVLARLRCSPHPGIVKLLDASPEDTPPWIALSFIAGPQLASVYPTRALHSGEPSGLDQVLRMARLIADAVAAIHGQGIIHCDLSPRNILLDSGTQPVVIDFNLALMASRAAAGREILPQDANVRGTAGYMSPEQIAGSSLDTRSDLYALGCVLYEVFVGEPPFRADRVDALCRQHLHLAPRPPSSLRNDLPLELDALLLALLGKHPEDRPPSAEAVVAALAALDPRGAPAPHHQEASGPKLHRARCIGRDTALHSLADGLNSTTRGRGGLCVVSGASGVGKTRLLDELAVQARGFRIISSRCAKVTSNGGTNSAVEGRALEPFLPFLAWLADYKEAHGTAIAPELSAAMAVLAAYEPKLRAEQVSPAVSQLSPALGRSRVLRSLVDSLVRTSAQGPLLLIIDDLQWADDLSRAFLSGTYPSLLGESRVMIVVAHRTEELAPEFFGASMRQVTLGPLSLEYIGALAKQMLGVALVPAGVADLLYHHSEGNPLFAVEYLRAFTATGLLRRTGDGDWALANLHQQPVTLPIPASLQEIFELRVAGLSANARRALEAASLLGREFHAQMLATVQDLPMYPDLHDTLRELLGQHILERCGPDEYRFVHEQLREAQRRNISTAQRRTLHQRVATRLEKQKNVQPNEATAAQLGLHWAEAGEPARAVAYLGTAARQAAAQHRIGDAAGLFALAIAQSYHARQYSGDDTWAEQIIHLGEARGDLLGWSARHEEAAAQYTAVLPLVTPDELLTRARLERKIGKAHWTLHEYDKSMLALNRAESLLGDVAALSRTEELREWIDVQQGLFWLHYFAGRSNDTTEPLMRRMSGVVDEHGTVIQKSMFYESAASSTVARDRYRYSHRALELAQRSNSEISATSDEPGQAAEARFVLAFVLALGTVAQCRQAVDLFEENLQTLAAIGEATLLARSLIYLAVARRRTGDVQATRLAAANARSSAERARLVPYVGAALACEAWVQWRNGDTVEARRLAEEAHIWWAKADHCFPFQWLANFVLLDILYASDDFSAAAPLVQQLLNEKQQRLPKAIDASLSACAISLKAGASARAASLALRQVLELGHEHGYL